jgi:hypothetical protein
MMYQVMDASQPDKTRGVCKIWVEEAELVTDQGIFVMLPVD